MIRKVVITGATSSIGTALVDECVDRGISVLALVNPGSKNISRINTNKCVEIYECSLDSICNLDIEGKYDAFIHLAWASTAGDAARNQLMPQIRNIQYSVDAVGLASRLGCEVFIGAGSQAEYGRTEEVLTECTVTNPETAYGMAKLCAGQMTRLACYQLGVRHIWPRILSAYGPNCQPQTVINYTIKELLHGHKPSLSAGEQIWDFIYTYDVAKALLKLAECGRDGEIYVIGSGHSKRLRDYLLEVRDMIDPNLELGIGDNIYGPNTVMHLECSIDKLVNDTGFIPSVDFKTGISNTIEWIKKNQ